MSELASTPVRNEQPLKVLLLEDSRFDAELLREALMAAYPKATLEVARGGEEFAEALAEQAWDVVLSDYELPGFSGEQALAQVRARAPEVPFIFVSGVIGEDNAVEMLKRGATDYVSKSRLSRLPLVMNRALRESAERQALDRARADLREANVVYERVVNTLRNYAVILMDPQGRVTSWNHAATDIFGWTAAEMLGRPAERIFTPEDRAAGVMAGEMATAQRTGKADDNRWLMRRDGLRLWAEGVMVAMQDEAGRHNGFCKVIRDATENYRTAEALRSAKEQAERANAVKDRFIAILSHELRTPLAPIATAATLLERVATVPPRFADVLPMIRRNVSLEARLIDDLLDLTAITQGKLTLKQEQVDMHHVVHAVVQMLEQQLREGGLALHLELAATRVLVSADPARMQQVVWNLLRNAVKFTPEGGSITVRTSSDAHMFLLQCTDSGIGIESAALEQIFEPFQQADRDVTRRFGGLGLGLAIARGLALQHGGHLQAESRGSGQGATFTLTLPLPPVEQGSAAAGEAGAPATEGSQRHVLLVEDSVDAAETMVMLLEAYGWRVTHVATCAAAIAAEERGHFDVVLTDLGLPDGSGIDIGRRLSARMPVVALSGYGAAPDLRDSAMAGFAEHLVKPADPQRVHAALLGALRRQRG